MAAALRLGCAPGRSAHNAAFKTSPSLPSHQRGEGRRALQLYMRRQQAVRPPRPRLHAAAARQRQRQRQRQARRRTLQSASRKLCIASSRSWRYLAQNTSSLLGCCCSAAPAAAAPGAAAAAVVVRGA